MSVCACVCVLVCLRVCQCVCVCRGVRHTHVLNEHIRPSLPPCPSSLTGAWWSPALVKRCRQQTVITSIKGEIDRAAPSARARDACHAAWHQHRTTPTLPRSHTQPSHSHTHTNKVPHICSSIWAISRQWKGHISKQTSDCSKLSQHRVKHPSSTMLQWQTSKFHSSHWVLWTCDRCFTFRPIWVSTTKSCKSCNDTQLRCLSRL